MFLFTLIIRSQGGWGDKETDSALKFGSIMINSKVFQVVTFLMQKSGKFLVNPSMDAGYIRGTFRSF